MKLSVNGHSQVPPGFRFHPTEEELLHYYLRKKVSSQKIDLDVIQEVDLNKIEPWDIQEICNIGTTPQNEWYFFSHKDKKYPSGTRTNRATIAGFWKATGRDKVIYSSGEKMGMRKTLVFYRGRAPHGHKSDWIMHEYRLDDSTPHVPSMGGEEGWVVCRVFRKKNFLKTRNDDDILTCVETPPNNLEMEFENPLPDFQSLPNLESSMEPCSGDWAAMDRLVASQLEGQQFFSSFDDGGFSFPYEHDDKNCQNISRADNDIWSFTTSSSSSSDNPLCHLSV